MPISIQDDFQGLNPELGFVKEGSGQTIPSLQATEYRPKSLSSKVSLCLSAESVSLIENPDLVVEGTETCNFGSDDVVMHLLAEGVRFVPLGVPRTFVLDKKTKEISQPVKGQKLAGTSKVTATKLFLAVVKNGKLVMQDGEPLVVSLKLTSNKTKLVTGDYNDSDYPSVYSLNSALQKYFDKPRASLTHLVSVELKAVPRKMSSKADPKEASVGIMFELEGNAKPLSSDDQQVMFDFVQSDYVKGLLADPFNLSRKQSPEPLETLDEPIDITF